MDFLNVFTTPVRAKLKFGEPLDAVCGDGDASLHAGLKDLFLKAYLSARGDPTLKSASAVLAALKSGPKGQGSLSQRMALKAQLEAGEWLVPVRTAPGAPLWLLRHFLGRLPEPLLKDPEWKSLGGACGAALSSSDAVVERIAVSARRTLSRLEFETLGLLALLIRKLSSPAAEEEEEPRDEVLNALGQYFVGALVARPFRPGLYTAVDRASQPLLLVLAEHWRLIFQEGAVSRRPHKYFPDEHDENSSNARYTCRFIGFESLLVNRDHGRQRQQQQQQLLDNDFGAERLRNKRASGAISSDSTPKNSREEEELPLMAFGDAQNRPALNEAGTQSDELGDESIVKNSRENINIVSKCDQEHSDKDVTVIEYENCERVFFFNEFKSKNSNKHAIFENQKFFSVPNSEDSE